MLREILNLLSKDNLQAQALDQCYEMLDLCDKMVPAAVTSLRQRDDATLGVDVYQMDEKLNAFERGVRRKVMTHLSLGHTADISQGLTLVSIVIDIERIGDYTKNIADLAANHPDRLDAGELEVPVQRIETSALEIFSRTAKAFKGGDINESRELMKDYKEDISQRCREIESKIVSGETSLPTVEAVTVALYLRFLKRISAHSRNLISSVVNPFDRIGYPE